MGRQGGGSATRIRQLREARGMIQDDLATLVAKRLGRPFDISLVSRVESGGRDLSADEIVAFADVFRVRAFELFADDGEASA